MKQVKDLSCAEIIALVQAIQGCLYLDRDAQGRELWNPNKSWNADVLDDVGKALQQHGLAPTSIELAEPPAEPTTYVLYDIDSGELVGSRVYDDRGLAADDASELNDVIVVPIILPSFDAPERARMPEPCECQQSGEFCSGVPGILAKVENCRVVPGGKIERCDLCQRYPSDRAARCKLIELEMV